MAVAIVAIITAMLVYKWPVIKFGFDDGGKYTERDRQVYDAFRHSKTNATHNG